MNRFVNAIRKLLDEASLYADLLIPSGGEIRACIELVDTGDIATLMLSRETSIVEGSAHPDFKISMSKQTFQEIIQGKADAFALAGRAHPDEVRPIEFEVYNKERSKEVWETIKALLTYLFIPGKVKVKNLPQSLLAKLMEHIQFL